VTGKTKRLLLVTARATWTVLPGRERVKREKVVRVNVPGSHAAIMAIGARLLAVAIATEPTVVARDLLMAG
jgi:hypothetical protein